MFVRPGLIELQGTPPPAPAGRKSGIAKPPSGGLAKPTTRTSIAGADRRKSVKETPKAARSRSSSQNRSKVSSAKPSRDPSPKTTSSASPDQKGSPSETITETASKETPLSPVQESKPIVSGIQQSIELTNQIKTLQREKDELAKEVKDWQERTESLVVKRRQDRENLKDAERNRIQLQQLEEFKGRIMEQHNDLKKELREERKRREDLADEFDAFRNG